MRLGFVLIVVSLAGCSDDGTTRSFNLSRDAAPVTIAATQMPLSAPPSLAQRPSRPGAPAPREASPEERAVGSAGQDALLQAAGPAAASDIRELINENSGLIDPGPEFTDRLMSWTPPPGSAPMSAPTRKGWLSRLF